MRVRRRLERLQLLAVATATSALAGARCAPLWPAAAATWAATGTATRATTGTATRAAARALTEASTAAAWALTEATATTRATAG